MQQSQIQYPVTKRDNTIDKHNLADPYRWLEDPDSQETQQWVQQQNEITNKYLNQYQHKEKLTQKLTDIYKYEKYGPPYKRGDNYYYSKNDGLQNQYVIYTVKNLNDTPEVFIDPNTLSDDGTIALSNSSFSEDGKLWAYSLSKGGSDWKTVYVKDVQSKKDLNDKLEFVKFCGFSWTHDNKGFFYNQYPKPKQIDSTEGDKAGTETDSNLNQKVYYHRIGTPQSEDILIFENPEDPKKGYSAQVCDEGKYLILSTHDGCGIENKLYFADITNFSKGDYTIKFNKVVDDFKFMYDFIANNGSKFYFLTNYENAQKNKIICIDIQNYDQKNWVTIVEESKDVLQEVYAVNNNQFLALYNQDVHDVMKLFQMEDGKFIREIPTPAPGSVGIKIPKRNQDELFYLFTSFLYPTCIYHYKYSTNEVQLYKGANIEGFNPDDYETKQIFYENKNDKTKIPMFIIQKKGSTEKQPTPFYLYGYGGFNVSISPSFSPFRIIMMKHLGINIAIANIRGGGEYGEEWHQQGTKEKKQNVFDDFCFAAEYLIDNKLTTSDKLAICGGSNGGLLVGACINQRPELFKVGIAQVGVLDMLRFHLFTIGHAWCSDYGNPDDENDFKYLIKYSPLHNVNKQNKGYPAVLLATGDHDDRVVPLHSFKYISELQYQLGDKEYQKEPLLIRIETKAGHGAGKPTSKIIEEVADIYGFMSLVMNLKWID